MDKITRKRIKKDKKMAYEIFSSQRTLARHGFYHGQKPPTDSFLHPLWLRCEAAKRRVIRIKKSLDNEAGK